MRVASIIVCFMGYALGTVLVFLCESDLFLREKKKDSEDLLYLCLHNEWIKLIDRRVNAHGTGFVVL